MASDPLDQVLRLVAEGKLTADEAAPILAALDERGPKVSAGDANRPGGATAAGAGPAPEPPRRGASSIRLEVTEGGRQIVNLRLPLAVGKLALDRIPGLSGEQVDRVREALSNGIHGPILVVDDDGDGVRIIVE